MGIVVNRKVGKAVVRNRVRRRLREALLSIVRDPQWLPKLATVDGVPSFDAMIIVRPSAAEASYGELKRALEQAIQRGRLS